MSISERPELHIALRHDFIQILSEKLTDNQITALVEDLENLNFNCKALRSEEGGEKEEEKEWNLLIGLNDQDKILQEAETQLVMVPRVYSNNDKEQTKQDRLK